jgi:hypothetical protein
MLKTAVPLILFVTAGAVWYYNSSHTDSALVIPLLDLIPSLRGDIHAQAAWSWRIVAGLGGIVLLINLVTGGRRKQDAEE